MIRDQRLGWWPVLGSKLLPFTPGRAGYLQKRYRVHPASRPTASRRQSVAIAPHVRAGARALPPGSFAEDCLVTMGARDDPVVGGNFPAWEKWARARGIKTYATDPGADGTAPFQPPTVGDLGVTIGKAIKAKCTDVFIFLSGHGKEPPTGERDPFADGGSFAGSYEGIDTSVLPTVSSVSGGMVAGGRGEKPVNTDITSSDVRELIVAFGKQGITFKVLVDACFSGRFANDLRQATPSNLLFLGTSAGADEQGYGFLQLPQGYAGDVLPFDHVYYRNGKRLKRYVKVSLPKRPKSEATEFSHGFLQAWEAFEASNVQVDAAVATAKATGTPLLVLGLRDAQGAVGRFDLTAKNGITKPKLVFTEPKANLPPLLTRFEASRVGTHTYYRLAAEDPEQRPLTYAWSNTNTCGTFAGAGGEADWNHPHPPCPNESPHPGVVTVRVTDGVWDCVYAYGSGSAAIAAFDPQETCTRVP